MARCSYRYADDEQCIIDNLPADRAMCVDHRLITQIAKDKKANDAKRYTRTKENGTRPSRAKPPRPTVIVPPEPSFFDHTAPWACGLLGCDKCKAKPSYRDYMTGRFV